MAEARPRGNVTGPPGAGALGSSDGFPAFRQAGRMCLRPGALAGAADRRPDQYTNGSGDGVPRTTVRFRRNCGGSPVRAISTNFHDVQV